jgi:cytidylate kinase
VSRAVAEALGIDRLDTGAMYRAVAWAAIQRHVDLGDHDALAGLAESIQIDVGDRVVVDGIDVTTAIRQPDVNQTVSMVAACAAVRTVLVERQRRWVVEHGGGVVEGRDIGSVVFPDAAVKIYLTASPEERGRRRSEEGADGVARRDRIDSTRAASPLEVADGAHVIDTTGRSVNDVVKEVLGWL